jgi:hypothetical protein
MTEPDDSNHIDDTDPGASPTPNPLQKPKNHTTTDDVISQMVRTYPNLNEHQIGKKIQQLGIIKHPETVYARLKKNEYLRADIAKIRANSAEYVSRVLAPAALEIHHKVLKDKDIPAKDKKDWVFQAEKLEFRTDDLARPGSQVTVNIKDMRVLIQGDV